jgi:tetratricopeptide (TPR) repeat protein
MWLRLLALLLLAATALPAGERPPWVEEALAAEAKWNSAEALRLFLEAEKVQPNDAFILQKIAKQYSDLVFERKDTAAKKELAEKALGYAQRSAALEPDNAVYALSLAICHGHLALVGNIRTKVELSRVIKDETEHALRLDPNYAWAHHLLGRWHGELATLGPAARFLVRIFYGRLPKASREEGIRLLRRATELEPTEPNHWIELGFALAAAGRQTEARANWERGLALAPTGPHDAPARQRARAALAESRP